MNKLHQSVPLVFLVIVLCLASCQTGMVAGASQPGADSEQSPFQAPLLDASRQVSIGADKPRTLLFLASLPLLASQIDTALLTRDGYGNWRTQAMERVKPVLGIKIRFATEAASGQADIQSGMLFLPVYPAGASHALSWIIHTKGTELRRLAVPSRNAGTETPIAAAYAALGYAVWCPDYAGMGDSAGTHPYCVPESLANSALDGLAAARSWLAFRSEQESRAGLVPVWQESGRLYVLGYSEGGLAAMATARAWSERPQAGLQLETVYAMGAPLNLTTGAAEMVRQDGCLDHPEYQIWLAMGWSRAYPETIRLDDILTQRIISEAVPLFDGSRDSGQLRSAISQITNKAVGRIRLSDIFKPEYLEQLRESPEGASLYAKEIEARLDRWLPPPDLPIILAASDTDTVVPASNSRSALSWVLEQAPQSKVELVRLGTPTHMMAGGEALLWAMLRLDSAEQEKIRQLAVH